MKETMKLIIVRGGESSGVELQADGNIGDAKPSIESIVATARQSNCVAVPSSNYEEWGLVNQLGFCLGLSALPPKSFYQEIMSVVQRYK